MKYFTREASEQLSKASAGKASPPADLGDALSQAKSGVEAQAATSRAATVDGKIEDGAAKLRAGDGSEAALREGGVGDEEQDQDRRHTPEH